MRFGSFLGVLLCFANSAIAVAASGLDDFANTCMSHMPSFRDTQLAAIDLGFQNLENPYLPQFFVDISSQLQEITGATVVYTKVNYSNDDITFLAFGRNSVITNDRSSNCMLAFYSDEHEPVGQNIRTIFGLGDPDRTAFAQGMSISLWHTSFEGFNALIRLGENLNENGAQRYQLSLFVFD